MRVLLAIEGVLMDNKAAFRRSTHPLHHTRKLVHLCHHTRGSCSSQRGQGSPKAPVSCLSWWLLAMLGAQLLESSLGEGETEKTSFIFISTAAGGKGV